MATHRLSGSAPDVYRNVGIHDVDGLIVGRVFDISCGVVFTANDQIPVSEVPQNGTPAYFPMQDGSSILAKSWQPDGTIATVRYIPEVQQAKAFLGLP